MLSNTGSSAVLMTVLTAVYFIGCWLAFGATLGQRILGLVVARAEAPLRLDPMRAVLRWFGLCGFAAVGILGLNADVAPIAGIAQLAWIVALLITTLQSPMKQGFHDSLARSVVVRGRLPG